MNTSPIDFVIIFLICLSRRLSFTDYLLSLPPLNYITLFFLYIFIILCLKGGLSLTGYIPVLILSEFSFLFIYLYTRVAIFRAEN